MTPIMRIKRVYRVARWCFGQFCTRFCCWFGISPYCTKVQYTTLLSFDRKLQSGWERRVSSDSKTR